MDEDAIVLCGYEEMFLVDGDDWHAWKSYLFCRANSLPLPDWVVRFLDEKAIAGCAKVPARWLLNRRRAALLVEELNEEFRKQEANIAAVSALYGVSRATILRELRIQRRKKRFARATMSQKWKAAMSQKRLTK
ncbi:MAG: hypothetical protein U1E66_05430 [Rhodospirillales bacterium]